MNGRFDTDIFCGFDARLDVVRILLKIAHTRFLRQHPEHISCYGRADDDIGNFDFDVEHRQLIYYRLRRSRSVRLIMIFSNGHVVQQLYGRFVVFKIMVNFGLLIFKFLAADKIHCHLHAAVDRHFVFNCNNFVFVRFHFLNGFDNLGFGCDRRIYRLRLVIKCARIVNNRLFFINGRFLTRRHGSNRLRLTGFRRVGLNRF